MKEVVYKAPKEPEYSDKPCPACGLKKLVHGSIPCPDMRIGCCVIHYGYKCNNCGKIFQP